MRPHTTYFIIRDTAAAIVGCAACSYAVARWHGSPERAFFAGLMGATLVLWALYNRGLPLPAIFHALGLLMFACERACRVLGDMGARFPREFAVEFMEVWGRLKEREREQEQRRPSC